MARNDFKFSFGFKCVIAKPICRVLFVTLTTHLPSTPPSRSMCAGWDTIIRGIEKNWAKIFTRCTWNWIFTPLAVSTMSWMLCVGAEQTRQKQPDFPGRDIPERAG